MICFSRYASDNNQVNLSIIHLTMSIGDDFHIFITSECPFDQELYIYKTNTVVSACDAPRLCVNSKV